MDYNRALNSACLGWAITLIAILLNVIGWRDASAFATPWNVFGIVGAVLALVAAYFGEGCVVSADAALTHSFHQRKCIARARTMQVASIACCAVSYLFWLVSL